MSELKSVALSQYLSNIEDLIEEARNGRMFVLVDDEDRETRATWWSPPSSPPPTPSTSWRATRAA